MCGRATLATPPDDLARLFGLEPPAASAVSSTPRYNIAPTDPVAVIRRTATGGRALGMMRWGLVPSYAKAVGEGPLLINVRVESLGTKRPYRDALASRRCLVVMDGFYEWTHGTPRTPRYIRRRDRQPMAMAGLWDAWRGGGEASEERLESCTIVTVPSTPPVSTIHDRMPLLVALDLIDEWLDPSRTTTTDLTHVLEARPLEDELESYTVHPRVNAVGEDHPENIEPFELQRTLFG